MADKSGIKGERLGAVDFCLGTLLGADAQQRNLRLRDGDRKVDSGFTGAYIALKNLIDDGDVALEPRFTIIPNLLHGDSETVRISMSVLNNIGILTREGTGNMYRLNLRLYEDNPETAQAELGVPGEFQMWRCLGSKFLEYVEPSNDVS